MQTTIEQVLHDKTILTKGVVFALSYTVLGQLLMWFVSSDFSNLIWPLSGLSLAVLLLGGQHVVIPLVAGSLVLYSLQAFPWQANVGMTAAHALEALLAFRLLTHSKYFTTVKQILRTQCWVLISIFAFSSAVAALCASTMLWTLGTLTTDYYLENLAHWWFSDMLGMILFAPLWIRCSAGSLQLRHNNLETVQCSLHYARSLKCLDYDKAAEEEIYHLAFYDPLTNLPNRRLLMDRLQYDIEVVRRERKLLALMMLDLDRFKAVNDTYGHAAGDELLVQVASRLKKRLRDVDIVARLGGDEFVVLLASIAQASDAARVASVIVADLSRAFQLSQAEDVRVGVSIGISLFPQHGGTPDTLIKQADIALYQAKKDGRGCFAYFSEKFTLEVRERIELEQRLRNAITQQALSLVYQPQVDVSSGNIIGAQALVRWHDVEKGTISPARFIPVAEESGLIANIGEWVLRQSCMQAQQWRKSGLPNLRLSVKLSLYQIHHGDINALVACILTETGFPAELLELELSESSLIEHDGSAEILQRLRAQGVQLVIDNFGTGHSSLTYFKRFPLDALKIGQIFIEEQDDMDVAATIVAMAHTLGMKALAKGVETSEQLHFLEAKGCDVYQGYFKSKPVAANEFVKLLQPLDLRPV